MIYKKREKMKRKEQKSNRREDKEKREKAVIFTVKVL
jgi:hypothetical protein